MSGCPGGGSESFGRRLAAGPHVVLLSLALSVE